MSKELIKQIKNNFTYHAPTPDQVETYTILRDAFKELAFLLVDECPQSRELSLALTKLEEAVMWANAAVARNKPDANK